MLANKLAIKPCGVAAPRRQRAHGRVPVSVVASQQGPPAQPEAPSTRRRVLPIVSELLEAEAAVNLFERVAGRSAMIGFAVATAVEVLLPGPDTGLFGAWAQSDIAGQFAALGMVLLCCSVGLAARTYRPMSRRRHRLMEPMLCSLTSGRRSFAGVTQQNVDRWVDSVFASVFTQPFVSANFLEEDKYI